MSEINTEIEVIVEETPVEVEEMTPDEVDEAIQVAEHIPIKQESKVSSKFLPLKATIIDDILKIDDTRSRRTLTRMRKSELKEILGTSFEQKCEEVLDVPTPQAPDKILHAMYTCCLGLCNLMEVGTKRFHMYMPGGLVLHNFAEKVDVPQNREVILDCLQEIYEKNSQLIKSYMTVETRLLFVFGVSMASSVKSYKSINEAGLQADPHYQPNRRGQDNSYAIPHHGSRPSFRDVQPNNRFFEHSRQLGLSVPTRRQNEEKEQSNHSPRLSVHRKSDPTKHACLQKRKAPDSDSHNLRRHSVEDGKKLPDDRQAVPVVQKTGHNPLHSPTASYSV